jgi:hypothetical protein
MTERLCKARTLSKQILKFDLDYSCRVGKRPALPVVRHS